MTVFSVLSTPVLIGLMSSLLLALVPLYSELPSWVVFAAVLAILELVRLQRRTQALPSRALRVALILTAVLMVWFQYRSFIGLEPMVALLVLGVSLKLLECAGERDVYQVVFLGLFLVATGFLFSQSLPISLVGVLALAILLTTLVSLNRGSNQWLWQDFRLAILMLLLAAPLMLVMFVFFPRIAPLWSVPNMSGQAITGMSDTLAPGSVAKLGRSAEVVFRARFDGDIPPAAQRYWRGVVLSDFDGEQWQSVPWRQLPEGDRRLQSPSYSGESVNYRVVQEPTRQRWLFALPYAQSDTAGVFETVDYRLAVAEPLESQFAYDVRSQAVADFAEPLSTWRHKLETHLPATANPRTRQWVSTVQNQYSTPETLAEAILKYFREQAFYYTLQPQPLSDSDFVDAFLFDSRRGFCEHYAYAFAVVMRMAGIPARVVAGYQGGEVNPLNNSVVVRQFDAHAWTEIWIAGRGWMRIDPTAAVAPERIELGLEAALPNADSFLVDSPLSVYRFRHLALVNWLRLRYDVMAYQWQSFIVGFDNDRQVNLLERWLGKVSTGRYATVFLLSWALVLVPLGLILARSRQTSRLSFAERSFKNVCRKLRARGLNRMPGETPRALLVRAENDPRIPVSLLQALAEAELQLYASRTDTDPH